MSVFIQAWAGEGSCPHRPEEDTKSRGAGVPGNSCELTSMAAGNSGSPERVINLLPAEPPLQPHISVNLKRPCYQSVEARLKNE